MLWERYNGKHPVDATEEEKIELRYFEDLRKKVTAENAIFQASLKEAAFSNANLYNTISDKVRFFIQKKILHSCNHAKSYPQYYEDHTTIDLFVPVVKKLDFERQSTFSLTQNSTRFRFPSLSVPTWLDSLAEDYLSDSCLRVASEVVSRDDHSEHFARQWNCQFVISLKSFAYLTNSISPDYCNTWMLPVVVKYIVGQDGKPKKVVFFDKPLTYQILSSRQQNELFYKCVFKYFLTASEIRKRVSEKPTVATIASDNTDIGSLETFGTCFSGGFRLIPRCQNDMDDKVHESECYLDSHLTNSYKAEHQLDASGSCSFQSNNTEKVVMQNQIAATMRSCVKTSMVDNSTNKDENTKLRESHRVAGADVSIVNDVEMLDLNDSEIKDCGAIYSTKVEEHVENPPINAVCNEVKGVFSDSYLINSLRRSQRIRTNMFTYSHDHKKLLENRANEPPSNHLIRKRCTTASIEDTTDTDALSDLHVDDLHKPEIVSLSKDCNIMVDDTILKDDVKIHSGVNVGKKHTRQSLSYDQVTEKTNKSHPHAKSMIEIAPNTNTVMTMSPVVNRPVTRSYGALCSSATKSSVPSGDDNERSFAELNKYSNVPPVSQSGIPKLSPHPKITMCTRSSSKRPDISHCASSSDDDSPSLTIDLDPGIHQVLTRGRTKTLLDLSSVSDKEHDGNSQEKLHQFDCLNIKNNVEDGFLKENKKFVSPIKSPDSCAMTEDWRTTSSSTPNKKGVNMFNQKTTIIPLNQVPDFSSMNQHLESKDIVSISAPNEPPCLQKLKYPLSAQESPKHSASNDVTLQTKVEDSLYPRKIFTNRCVTNNIRETTNFESIEMTMPGSLTTKYGTEKENIGKHSSIPDSNMKPTKIYQAWSLGDKRLLLRFSEHGNVADGTTQVESVNITSKVEYQSQYGLEQVTPSEAIEAWIKTYVRCGSHLLRGRIDIKDTKVLKVEKIPVSSILHGLDKELLPAGFLRTYNIFCRLESLDEGFYLLSHDEGQNFCVLKRESSVLQQQDGVFDLHNALPKMQYKNDIPWIPIDTNLIFPEHAQYIPGTFVSSGISNSGMQKKRKRKKNKGNKGAQRKKLFRSTRKSLSK